jgi:hypothetical protein
MKGVQFGGVEDEDDGDPYLDYSEFSDAPAKARLSIWSGMKAFPTTDEEIKWEDNSADRRRRLSHVPLNGSLRDL